MNIHDFQYHVDVLETLIERTDQAVMKFGNARTTGELPTEDFYGVINELARMASQLEQMQEEIDEHLNRKWYQKLLPGMY